MPLPHAPRPRPTLAAALLLALALSVPFALWSVVDLLRAALPG